MPNLAHNAALYTGSSAGLGAAPAATISVPFTAPQKYDAIIELSGAGDANGDGYSDILIRSSRFLCEIPVEFCGNLHVLLIYQRHSSGFAELVDIDVDPAFGVFTAAFAGSVNQDA